MSLIGERYIGASFRCRAIRKDGSQCRCKATTAVSYFVMCRTHRNILTKTKRELHFVELPETKP